MTQPTYTKEEQEAIDQAYQILDEAGLTTLEIGAPRPRR